MPPDYDPGVDPAIHENTVTSNLQFKELKIKAYPYR